MVKSRRNMEKELYWRNQVEQWHRSGQSIVTYCRNNGIKAPTFQWWKRELFIRDCQVSHADSSKDSEPEGVLSGFAEVKVVHPSPVISRSENIHESWGDSGLEVLLSGHRRIRVYPGFK